MKAHLIDSHLMVPRSRSFAKVRVKYEGHTLKKKKKKIPFSGALVFQKKKNKLFLDLIFYKAGIYSISEDKKVLQRAEKGYTKCRF